MAADQPLVGPAGGQGLASLPLGLSPSLLSPNGPSPSGIGPLSLFDLLIDFLFIK